MSIMLTIVMVTLSI